MKNTEQTHIITFHPDGTAVCLWTEAIPLEKLGGLTINRVSNIEFDNESQRWQVRFVGEKEIRFSSESRQACINWEIETLTS